MKSLFFAIRRHSFRLVLQINLKQLRLILEVFQREKFVNKQLFVNITERFQNNSILL